MRQYIIFCMMALLVYGCESAFVDRFLEDRYCPEALILKGAERLTRWQNGRPIMEAELVQLKLSCDVATKGEMGAPSFAITGIYFDAVFHGQIKAANKNAAPSLPLFMALVRKEDHQVIKRHIFTLPARNGRFSRPVELAFDSAAVRGDAQYIVLGGFVVNEAQIEYNLKPLKNNKRTARQPSSK